MTRNNRFLKAIDSRSIIWCRQDLSKSADTSSVSATVVSLGKTSVVDNIFKTI
jgi:hypothetical protein